MEINFNADDNFPLNKQLNVLSIIINNNNNNQFISAP